MTDAALVVAGATFMALGEEGLSYGASGGMFGGGLALVGASIPMFIFRRTKVSVSGSRN